jgi:sulfur relay (sulfurtransferase) complex TusBCD TusD component (DsrE family)
MMLLDATASGKEVQTLKVRTYSAILLTLLSVYTAVSGCAPRTTVVAQSKAAAPLFINLTSNDAHRVRMALSIARIYQQRGHPVTIFLNDRAVDVAAKKKGTKFAEQQKTLAVLAEQGAVVLVCPMCMKQYGVQESDLLPGLVVADADKVGQRLFQPDTRTLSW